MDARRNTLGDTLYETMLGLMPDRYADPADSSQSSGIYANARTRTFSMRHGYASNALFFDSHVQTVQGSTYRNQSSGQPDCIWDGY